MLVLPRHEAAGRAGRGGGCDPGCMALEFGTSIIFTDPVAAEYGRVEAIGEAATDIELQPAQAPRALSTAAPA